jgi:hypothetical protein
MQKILINIISGRSPILLYVNNTISIRPLTGYMGVCSVGNKIDVALTASYELSKFFLIPKQKINSDLNTIIDFVNGDVLFYLQHAASKEYLGVIWPGGNCNNPNISIVENKEDALSVRLLVTNNLILDNINVEGATVQEIESSLELVFTGKTDIRLKATGNSAWNNDYIGVCGYGPCKTKSVGLMPEYSESILRMISVDLHKINCCIDVTSIDKCETIPVYDCDPVMNLWCKDNKNNYKEECLCINSKSLLPQCFDKDCYQNKKAYYKDKVCERSHVDCVGIYAKIKKKDYTEDIKSICGPYENLRNEYLEKGLYLRYFDFFSILEDNWSVLLIIFVLFSLFLLFIAR